MMISDVERRGYLFSIFLVEWYEVDYKVHLCGYVHKEL